jgi:energy-converting hydrogenase Eha subunit H
MQKYMQLPPFYNIVLIVAKIAAAIGCISGILTIFAAFAAFNYGLFAGLTAIAGGIYIILASLGGLGIAYGFLAVVKAQIDSRNVLVMGASSNEEIFHPENNKQEPTF